MLFSFHAVLRDARFVFIERDTDGSGLLDMVDMSAAMRALKVDLSDDDIKALFKACEYTRICPPIVPKR